MRRLCLGLLIVVLAGGAGTVSVDADEPARKPPSVAEAADAVIAALAAADASALRTLAEADEPDPWIVAAELLRRALPDAALAFARAAPRPDTARLPAYVESRRETSGEAGLHRAVAAVLEARAARDAEAALEAAASAGPLVDTVPSIRLGHERGLALRALRRLEESATVFLEVASAAERIGWLRRAAAACYEGGRAAWRRGDRTGALTARQRWLALEETRGNAEGVARALGDLGNVHAALGEYARALEVYERAITAREALGDRRGAARTLANTGLVYEALGDYPRARACHERARETLAKLGDRSGVANALANLGNVHFSRGDFPKALLHYERALEAMHALKNGRGVAMTLACIAGVHHAFGDYAAALEHYERAIEAMEAVADQAGAAGALANLGTVYYRLGDIVQAQVCLERAFDVLEALGDREGAARALGNTGLLHEARGAYGEALTVYQRALERMEALGDREGAGRMLGNVGNAHLGLGDHAQALSVLERALEAQEALGDRAGATETLADIGHVHAMLDEHTDALSFYERAARRATRLRVRPVVVRGHTGAARAKLAAGDPGRALLTAHRALSECEYLLGGLAETEGATAREQFADLFGVGALAAARLEEPAEVLTFLENGRAGLLLETLGGGAAVRLADLPDDLVAAEAEAKAKESRARWEHARARDTGRRRDVRRATRAVDDALALRREVAARIQRQAKRVAGVFYPRAATLDEVQGWMEPDTALVVYGLCLDVALALVVRPDDARVVQLGTTEAIEALCHGSVGIGPDAKTDPAEALTALRARLVEPLGLAGDVTSVLVSPDGPLGYVPWGALFERAVTCVPSATTWVLLREEEPTAGHQVVALGDPVYDVPAGDRAVAIYRGGHLVRLPETRVEAESIGDVVLLGEQANEARLVAALGKKPRWRALHLACHGLVDTERPMLSSLALTPTGDDDGFLTCLEVFGLDVPADLVVLSACETARGKLVKAEGIVGLTRAFMYAGAPRVLCSLWNVDDEATRALMIRFYELWNPKEGEPGGAADALAAAQRYVRDHPDHPKWKHPHYWAAWVLWGLAE